MNYKKVSAIAIITLTCFLTLSMVSANDLQPIEIGEITNDNIKVIDFDESTYNLNFLVNIEVDISKLTPEEKNLLEEAINDNDTSFTLNLTDLSKLKISLWTSKAPDKAYIKDDTLFVQNEQNYHAFSGFSTDDLEITALAFNTTDGQLFATDGF